MNRALQYLKRETKQIPDFSDRVGTRDLRIRDTNVIVHPSVHDLCSVSQMGKGPKLKFSRSIFVVRNVWLG